MIEARVTAPSMEPLATRTP